MIEIETHLPVISPEAMAMPRVTNNAAACFANELPPGNTSPKLKHSLTIKRNQNKKGNKIKIIRKRRRMK